jgi:hypothetical protein
MRLSLRPKNAKARRIQLVISALVILAIGFGLVQLSSTGSEGQPTVVDTTSAGAPAPELVSQTGTYIGFSYPSSFSKIPAEQLGGNQLEAFSYLKRPSPFWHLNIEINRLPSGNLADDGSYNARKRETAIYDHSFWLVNGNQVDVFSDKTAPYAKAAFMAQNHLMLSAALTADSADNSLDPILLNTLKSVYWIKD